MLFCLNVASCSEKEACFRLAGSRDLIYEHPVVLGLFVEFGSFGGSNTNLNES